MLNKKAEVSHKEQRKYEVWSVTKYPPQQYIITLPPVIELAMLA